ncbi:hypothetical protein OROGR_019319 [Orobanche gracilis]
MIVGTPMERKKSSFGNRFLFGHAMRTYGCLVTKVKIREEWCMADGANSKEVEGQKNRIRREREIVYRSIQEIPSNPKEPWDREMDSDDTLTPEIPIEQLPDVEPLEPPSDSHIGNNETVAPPVASTLSENMPEPDIELLAELLKNPRLVFALTSGQAGNLSSDATVKLLDMIKANGADSLSKLAGDDENKVVVSLPSPTPSTEPVPVLPSFVSALGTLFIELRENWSNLEADTLLLHGWYFLV